ncbi:hypothetical protein SUGI_0148740 [Cryptomeria japonica]|uniref:uncharacterized protein LOC131065254 n=1 Tax=Cryptomeria japonica TaxID=3369 RepID=UPI002408DCED|nr:uncharacterized protein LOC131065254 [Cryptomeria japonica]GLJ11254.1 hypothetical protein SUGI_0148740 [Cryptomeria japonica]
MAVSSQLPLSDPDTSCNDPCSGDSSTNEEGDSKQVFRAEYRDKLLKTLRCLRALVPKGRGSLAEDTVAYVQQLKDGIESIQSEIHGKILSSQRALFATIANRSPQEKVMVEMKDSGLEILVECEKKPGLALALSKAIDSFNLTIIQARMTCQLRISFFVLSEKTIEGAIVDPEQLKTILQQTVSSYTGCSNMSIGN